MDNIREDLLKYHQEYKADKEGLAYAERAIATVNDLEKRPEANGIPTGEGMDLYRRGYRTIGNGITTRYIREGGIDLIGAEIDSPEDLAAIMQSYRNPLYETTRVFYLQKNKVIATEGISNQLPNLVTVEFSDADRPAEHIAKMTANTLLRKSRHGLTGICRRLTMTTGYSLLVGRINPIMYQDESVRRTSYLMIIRTTCSHGTKKVVRGLK